MSLHGLAYTVLLAVPAFAVPRPHAHRSLSAHDTCDDIATPHGFQLGIAEGCLSAKSKHCKDVLSIYQICLSPADDDQAAPVASDTASSSGSSTSDSIFATMTPSPNASVVVNLETRTSWTTTTTQTTVYYMYERNYLRCSKFIFGIEHGRSYFYGSKLIFGIEHGTSYSCGNELDFGVEHAQSDLDLSRAY
ncbi:hypothetical protein KC346_g16749 [Hortaea werneckii]|nr:hypothetical protein KC346_g16749 [Hortaea werneckii]